MPKNRSRAERDELRRQIEFDPDLFVAQERVEFSTAPSWDNGACSRPIGLRVYLVATATVTASCPAA